MGAVATTFIAGVYAVRKGLGSPTGSLSEMGFLLSPNGAKKKTLIKDALPVLGLDQMVFGGWDITTDNAYQVAKSSEVLERYLLEELQEDLEKIVPMPAVYDPSFVQYLEGTHVKSAASKWELAQQIREDIRAFKNQNNCDRMVIV